jgi:hypothetical protein
MGLSAKNFVRMPLLLSLLLCGSNLVQSLAVASQDSPEGAIFDQALKEAAQELAQQKKEQARTRKQLLPKQRSSRQFESLLAKARQQSARIKDWQKRHSGEWRIYASSVRNKRHLLVANTLYR